MTQERVVFEGFIEIAFIVYKVQMTATQFKFYTLFSFRNRTTETQKACLSVDIITKIENTQSVCFRVSTTDGFKLRIKS